ncbi:site-specific integrase [Sorangium sp. So ce764]|uniref:tyrosine-type recombinase/integrase n=1 Tax=Sorangium sp. So ce764 TaxID=3133320 RepID=UPI003F61564A
MIRKTERRGQRVLVIDIRWRKPDGSKGRYRRDAQVQTMAAAAAEERRLIGNIAQHGDVHEPKPAAPKEEPEPVSTAFGEVVARYRASFMVTDLKVTSRRGYASVLTSLLLPKFKDRPITKVDGESAAKLDLELTKHGLAKSTRNNIQIVLRSVLRFAVERKYLDAMPSGLPRLKQPEPTILEIPTDEQVTTILGVACPTQRLAFSLMAYAGLRPNEVRALLRRDVVLRREDGEPVGGFLSIREGLSYGEVHTPKTGQREVPIARPLAQVLGPVEKGSRDGHVARSRRGKPWGQYGLEQAFERVRNRAGFAGWSVYSLRHYAITSWLRKGIPVHVVQKMAGHRNLATTQHYVHFLKADLEDAARRLDSGRGDVAGGVTAG